MIATSVARRRAPELARRAARGRRGRRARSRSRRAAGGAAGRAAAGSRRAARPPRRGRAGAARRARPARSPRPTRRPRSSGSSTLERVHGVGHEPVRDPAAGQEVARRPVAHRDRRLAAQHGDDVPPVLLVGVAQAGQPDGVEHGDRPGVERVVHRRRDVGGDDRRPAGRAAQDRGAPALRGAQVAAVRAGRRGHAVGPRQVDGADLAADGPDGVEPLALSSGPYAGISRSSSARMSARNGAAATTSASGR